MKRLMIVGASAWQVPMILKAKELGYEVGVIDYNPSAIGIKYADKYFNVSTIDPIGVCNATKEYGAAGITTVATDMPMRAIAYTCESLGLVGISKETALNATDKARMIRKFEEFQVPHPWYFYLDANDYSSILDKITYPCISKPTDNSGSRGVVIVNNERELKAGIAYSSSCGRSGSVLIEELLQGDEISVEAIAVSGKVYILQMTDKLTTGAPHFVEMGHSQPSKYAQTMHTEIYEATARAMKAVGIENGPAHVEMMITSQGPKLIELGARLGGDFITTDLVPLSTGIDMLAAVILQACGEKLDLEPKLTGASAIRYMKSPVGVIKSVAGIDEAMQINGLVRAAMLKEIGDKAFEIHDSIDRIGYVIANADTPEQAVRICQKALNVIHIEIE